ncbi:MAG: hypothetical protein ACRDZO_11555 [Egibacteraceae bacterium]
MTGPAVASAEFQGSPGAVAAGRSWNCRTGPHYADVSGVQVTDVDVIPEERRFHVR